MKENVRMIAIISLEATLEAIFASAEADERRRGRRGECKGLVKSRGPRKIVNQCDPSGLDYSSAIALIVRASKSLDRIFLSSLREPVIRASVINMCRFASARHANSFIVLSARCSFNCVTTL